MSPNNQQSYTVSKKISYLAVFTLICGVLFNYLPGLEISFKTGELSIVTGVKNVFAANWNATDWYLYDTITINHSKVSADLTDFPVYVNMADLSANFWALTAAGTDIRVTTGGVTPTELPYELVSASSTLKTGELHFKANYISSTTDTTFRIYYNGTTTARYDESATYGAQNVWTNNYLAVWHMDEDPSLGTSAVRDSTAGSHHGSSTGAMTTSDKVSGKVGNAINFDGSNDTIYTGTAYPGVTSLNVSSWIKPIGWGENNAGYVFGYGDTDNSGFKLFVDNAPAGVSSAGFFRGDTGDGAFWNSDDYTLALSSYQYVNVNTIDVTNASTTPEIFINANAQTETLFSGPVGVYKSPAGENLVIGDRYSGTRNYDGDIDELRISSTTRSAAWISAEYTNQSTTTDFYSITDNVPSWNATDWYLYDTITINHSKVSADLTDFPVYVNMADLSANFWALTAAGTDIRVTTGGVTPTELPYELVSASSTLKTGELHFKANYISSTTDTTFRIYYNGTTTARYDESATYGAQNVWTNNYLAVWHMDEDPSLGTSAVRDSTAGSHHGTSGGSMTSGDVLPGVLGNNINFDNTDDYLAVGNGYDIGAGLTVTGWINPAGWGEANYGRIIDFSTNPAGFNLYLNNAAGNTNSIRFFTDYSATDGIWDSPVSSVILNTDQHFAVTISDIANTTQDPLMYLNGANVAVTQSANPAGTYGNTTSNAMFVGGNSAQDRTFNGDIDELRISSTERAASWIAAEYTNQSTTTDFYIVNELLRNTLTTATSSDPVAGVVAPGSGATTSDSFSFRVGAGTDVVTNITVAHQNASSTSLIEIVSSNGATVYGSVSNPTGSSSVITLSTNTLTVTTATTTYKIRVTPKSHGNLPNGNRGEIIPMVTYVLSWTGSYTPVGSDTAYPLMIDNQSLPSFGVVGSSSLAAKVDYTTGSSPQGVTTGDVNNDGYMDIINVNTYDNTFSTLLNNGDGTFATKVDYTTGVFPWDAATIDVNNDGYVDVVTANQTVSTISVLLNNGNGTFATKVDYTTGAGPYSVSTSDVNNDGYVDVVTANKTASTTSVLLNNGNGTFASKVDYTTGPSPFSVSTSDVNNDGYVDVVTANYTASTVSVLLNNGNGTFATKVDYTTGAGPFSVSTSDVNNDGYVDVVTVNNSGNSNSVFLNNSTTTLIAAVTGAGQATVSYTTPPQTDLGSIVVLRSTSTITAVPIDGTTYTVGTKIGGATVGCVDTTMTPKTADSCVVQALAGVTTYYFKVFVKDIYGNYSVGVTPTGSPFMSAAVSSSTISNHSAGQVKNAFSFKNKTNETIFAFSMNPISGAATTTSITFALSDLIAINPADFTNLKLYRDNNSNGTQDGGDTQLGGTGSIIVNGESGTISFTTPFTFTANKNYIVVADFNAPDGGAYMTVSLPTTGIISEYAGHIQDIFGTVKSVVHNRTKYGGGEAVGDAAPSGAGVTSGGGSNGGSSGADVIPDGVNINPDPNFRRPSANGDIYNTWTNPANVYTSDAVWATSNAALAKQSYNGFGFSIPTGNVITGIEVKLDGSGSTAAGTIAVGLSWNAGSNFTSTLATPVLGVGDVVYLVGGPAVTWGRSWTPAEFGDANFRLAVTANPSANTLRLDAIEVRVYHQAGGGGSGGGGAI